MKHGVSTLSQKIFGNAQAELTQGMTESSSPAHEVSALDSLFTLLTLDPEKDVDYGTKVKLNSYQLADYQERAQNVAQNILHAEARNAIYERRARNVLIFLDIIKINISKDITPNSVNDTVTDLYEALTIKPLPVESSPLTSDSAAKASNLVQAKPKKTLADFKLPKMSLDFRKDMIHFLELIQERIRLSPGYKKDIHIKQAETNKIDYLSMLTLDLISMKADNTLTEIEMKFVNERWEKIKKNKAERLLQVQSQGGKLAGIVARVAEWEEKIPDALTYEEMDVRNKMYPFELREDPQQEAESRERRQLRIANVRGYEPRARQIGDKAVAVDMEKRSRNTELAVQPYEMEDAFRHEMQSEGVRPLSKTNQGLFRGTMSALTGGTVWATEFILYIQQRRADKHTVTEHVEKQTLSPLPERKTQATKDFLPGLERHLKTGVKNGYLVGKKKTPEDAYWKPEVGDEALDTVSDAVGKKLEESLTKAKLKGW